MSPIRLATRSPPSQSTWTSGSPGWCWGHASQAEGLLRAVWVASQPRVPARTKDVLNHNAHGTKGKAAGGSRAAKIEVVGGARKGQWPCETETLFGGLDRESQEARSGLLVEERWKEKNQWCGKLLLTSFKRLLGEEGEGAQDRSKSHWLN